MAQRKEQDSPNNCTLRCALVTEHYGRAYIKFVSIQICLSDQKAVTIKGSDEKQLAIALKFCHTEPTIQIVAALEQK